MILHDQKSKILSNRRGVALLFALGILSLLLVLGLAFVTNAVVAQKAAFNNSSRSQAKLLAQSAISQIQTAVMEYQLEIENIRGTTGSTNDNILITDLSTIVSFNTSANADDQLSSKLPPPKPIRYNNQTEEDHYKDLETGAGASVDSLRAPQWVYVDNGQTGNNRRLIGRFAYRVLPPNSSTRMNLGYVLQGVSTTLPHPTVLKEVNQIPLAVDNSNLGLGTPLAFWDTVAGSPVVLPTQVERMVGSYNQFFSAWADYFPYTSTNREEQKWLKRWFDDGVTQPDLEVYRQELTGTPAVEYYHRFNLNMSAANWNDFKNQGSNSDAAVNALLNDPAIPFRNDPANSYTTADTALPTALQGGLPFLKLIGNNQGSFSTVDDLRKQIAANLLDYCDNDSVPTSDVSASNWSTLSSEPTYTGNEKTPYINEVGFGIKLFPLLEGGGEYQNSLVLKTAVIPELIVELIDLYGSPSRNYTYHGSVEKLQFDMTMTLAGTITYQQSDGTNSTEKTYSFTKEFTDVTDVLSFTLGTSPRTVEIDFTDTTKAKDFSAGYQIGSVAMLNSGTDYHTINSADVLETVKGLIPAKAGFTNTFTKVEIKAVKYQIKNSKFALGAMALTDNNNSNSGVDFVRRSTTSPDVDVEQGGSTSFTFVPFANLADAANLVLGDGVTITKANGYLSLTEPPTSDGSAVTSIFYIGGVEAVDPRQNLNVDVAQSNPKKTDWIYNPKIADFKNTEKALSMTIAEGNSLLNNLTQGLRNSVTSAKPSTTLSDYTLDSEFTLGEFDIEDVSDPAWNTTNHLSTAYIRNAPMESPWELGAIHRGAAWQTINLKNAASPQNINDPINLTDFSGTAGTSYQMGDGGILDQVKFTNNIWSYGKIDINMFNSSYLGHDNTRDSMLLRAMLNNFMEVGEEYNQAGSGSRALTPAEVTNITNGVETLPAPYPLTSRAQILFTQPNSPASLPNNPLGLNRGFWNYWATAGSTPPAQNDREQEELISKMISIFKTEPAQVTTFQADIIAQSILDVDGTIAKVDRTGAVRTQAATHGTFDYDATNNVYFDEITGEVKMRVTFDRNPRTGKIKVRNITYTK